MTELEKFDWRPDKICEAAQSLEEIADKLIAEGNWLKRMKELGWEMDKSFGEIYSGMAVIQRTKKIPASSKPKHKEKDK